MDPAVLASVQLEEVPRRASTTPLPATLAERVGIEQAADALIDLGNRPYVQG
jgi:hypothetical protein